MIQNVASVDDPSTNVDDALDFIEGYINPMIIFSYGWHNLILLFWLILGRFLKVNRPGVARRYKLYWYLISIICFAGLSGAMYFYMDEYDGFFYMQQDIIMAIFNWCCNNIFYFILFSISLFYF